MSKKRSKLFSHLTPEAMEWQKKLSWENMPANAESILEMTLEAFDDMRHGQAEAHRDGPTVFDRWGQYRLHPAATIALSSCLDVRRGLKMLRDIKGSKLDNEKAFRAALPLPMAMRAPRG